jgi:hypothetical protein
MTLYLSEKSCIFCRLEVSVWLVTNGAWCLFLQTVLYIERRMDVL